MLLKHEGGEVECGVWESMWFRIIVLGIIHVEIIFKVMIMIDITKNVSVARKENTSEDSALGHLNLRVRKIRRNPLKRLKMNL